jgi:hypothetical protein
LRPIEAFAKEEHFDYQAMLDEAIDTIASANVELGPQSRGPDQELEAALDPLRKVKEAQALFAPALTVQQLSKRDFQARDLEPSPEVAKWMRDHRFYLVQVPVTLVPAFGWNFVRLKCWVGFETSGEASLPSAHDIYPENVWTEILQLQANLNLGLDERLRFRAGLGQTEVALRNLSGEAQARVIVVAEGGGSLVVGPFDYRVQRAEVLSAGQGNAEVFWQLDGHEHVQREEPYLAVVLRVPKKAEVVNAQGALIAYHDFDFWGAHLTYWWGDFRDKLHSFFRKGVPIEKTAHWENITA